MQTPVAHAFHSQALDDELYPLLDAEADSDLFLGVYPAAMADLDFAATVQALPLHSEPPQSQSPPQLKPFDDSLLHQPLNLPQPHDSAPLSPSAFPTDRKPFFGASPRKSARTGNRQRARPRVASAPSSTRSDSPTCSPPSSVNGGSDGGASSFRDSEEILNAPVKSLNEEEKKLRRRAQVAKSARKHRNRQKEELARLREQVQTLQEQMAIMTHHQGATSPTSIKREQAAITQHRKRKKVDDAEDEDVGAGVLTDPNVGLISMPPQKPHIQHWYHRLPVDTLERSTMLTHIADKRMAIGEQCIRREFSAGTAYPLTDIKLNSNGPDLEIKQVRGRLVAGFTHHEVGEACWNSFSNFVFDVPERFRRHVTCERLMELDSNTRYGRTIVPLLRDHKGRMVYFHSYFLVRRHVRENFVMITWETITDDDLYPPPADENPETTLRNDEVGWYVFAIRVCPCTPQSTHSIFLCFAA
jgi:hypothetical protein